MLHLYARYVANAIGVVLLLLVAGLAALRAF